MINFKKKHIALGLAIVSLTACIKTKSKHGIAGPDYIDKSIVEEQINKGMSIEDLNRALNSDNIMVNDDNRYITTVSKDEDGVVTFKFDKGGKDGNIYEFKSNSFVDEGGVLTSSHSKSETLYALCDESKEDACLEGRNKDEVIDVFKKDGEWDKMSDADKEEVLSFLNNPTVSLTLNISETSSLKLFGNSLDTKLSYSNFGNMQIYIKESYKRKSGSYDHEVTTSHYFGYGDVSKKQDLANNTSFTGKAFATVNYINKDKGTGLYKDLEGTASLNVNGGGDKNLEIALKDYYTLKFNDLVLSDVSGNNKLGDSNFDFIEGSKGGEAKYQGYGDGSASEVVGVFNTQWINNDEEHININGSFGATKNP